MRRLRKKLSSVWLLGHLIVVIFGSCILQAQTFPSTLTTNNTLFMQKLQQWYDYVHYRYDAHNIALNHANLTADEYDNALSRWTLAWHPLLCTLAFERTGDAKYLMEAKFFVDELYGNTSAPHHTLVITPRNGLDGLLDADIPMVWAMQKLNEHFSQSYDVTGYISHMKTVAAINNSTDLAWGSPWYAPVGVTFDEELSAASFMAYLTYKGVGSYASDVQKMYHFLERYRVQDFYPYGSEFDPTQSSPDLTIIDMIYLLIAYHYLPSVFNTAHLQATLDGYSTTSILLLTEDADAGLAAMTELAVWKGFTINERLRTAWYQGLMNFQINNTIHTLLVQQGERQNVVSMKCLLFALAFTGRTSAPNYVYGGYRRYPSHGVANVYQLNNTISYNNTDILGTAYFEYEGVRLLALWDGIDWNWDALAYNYTYGYYQGYKKGEGSLSGNDVRIRVWENFKKIQAEHTNINNNVAYPDSLAWEPDARASPCYLIFTNGTVYSLALSHTRTILGSNPLAWYEPQSGYLILYKIYDNSSSTMRWKITATGNQRGLSARARKFEAIPWIVPARIPTDTAVTNKAKALLSAYASGQDMVRRDFTFSTSSEGSIKWKLMHFSDITIYTDKNMTSSSYDVSKLAFTINAGTEQTSTTKIYVGPHVNDPEYVSGATSWSRSGNIITATKVHSSPARVLIFWKLPGDIDGDNDVDANDLHLLAAAYTSHVGEPRYRTGCDIDWDGDVDAGDLSMLADNYGRRSP